MVPLPGGCVITIQIVVLPSAKITRVPGKNITKQWLFLKKGRKTERYLLLLRCKPHYFYKNSEYKSGHDDGMSYHRLFLYSIAALRVMG